MQIALKVFLVTVGTLSLFLGILGIFLPLIPTTPLLLLASACYVRSSKKLHFWLLHHRWFGPYIQSFRTGKGIPFHAKVMAFIIIWFSFGFSAIFVVEPLLLKILFIGGACFFTVFLLRVKTLRRPPDGTTK